MAISQSLAITNLMNTLDNFLASMRLNIDNLSIKSVIQILNIIRCQNYGSNIDIFNNGVIFGLQACQIKQLGETWNIGYGPAGPDRSLLQNDNMNDWVITRGNIFDGNKIINIEPLDNQVYVYKISPYITEEMENYLIPGVVYYSTINHTFYTFLAGQTNINYPIQGIEKTGINKENFINNALNYKYFNSMFDIVLPSTNIKICRFILDVNNINNYEIFVLKERNLYPFIYGQPYYSYMNFSAQIYNYIKRGLESGYDSNVVENLFYYIVNAGVWGTEANAFYTYWTTGGRVLPDNVKYYYNILFDPDIP